MKGILNNIQTSCLIKPVCHCVICKMRQKKKLRIAAAKRSDFRIEIYLAGRNQLERINPAQAVRKGNAGELFRG